jgi:hypothetical protein
MALELVHELVDFGLVLAYDNAIIDIANEDEIIVVVETPVNGALCHSNFVDESRAEVLVP